jgi:hypothetical protein
MAIQAVRRRAGTGWLIETTSDRTALMGRRFNEK